MRDPDLVLVDSMLAPPPLGDARRSLEYWERRRKTLPVYRRAARREAREMAARWEDRVHAARIARFEVSPVGRFLGMLGISTAWLHRVRVSKSGILAFAWIVVPPKLKLIAGAVLAAWLVTAVAVLALAVAVFVQLLGS
jgi:hypothetical protein